MGDEKDHRTKMQPRFMEGNREKNMALVNQFKSLAEKKGCTIAQLALAWVLKQGDDIFPIPGTKRIKYLEENWNALNIHLSDEEEAEVRRFLEAADIAGTPLPPAFASYGYVDTVEEKA